MISAQWYNSLSTIHRHPYVQYNSAQYYTILHYTKYVPSYVQPKCTYSRVRIKEHHCCLWDLLKVDRAALGVSWHGWKDWLTALWKIQVKDLIYFILFFFLFSSLLFYWILFYLGCKGSKGEMRNRAIMKEEEKGRVRETERVRQRGRDIEGETHTQREREWMNEVEIE